MTWYLALALFTITSPLLLWVFFYLLFNTWAEMTDGRKPKTVIYYLVGVIGITYDLFVNATWGTALTLLQLPNINRLLFSARMDDLIVYDGGSALGWAWLARWRFVLALFIVVTFLEPFDLTIPKQHTTHGKQN